jgi:hypothetical protein
LGDEMSKGLVSGGNNDSLIIDSIFSDFVVDTGQTITAGDLVRFVNGKARKDTEEFHGFDSNVLVNDGTYAETDSIRGCVLETNKIFITYRTATSTHFGVVATIGNDGITFGTPVSLNFAQTGFIQSVKTLTSNLVCIAFYKTTSTYAVYLKLISISETVVTPGENYMLVSGSTGLFEGAFYAIYYSSTKFAVFYGLDSSSDYAKATVVTYSGVTISAVGTTINVINSAYCTWMNAVNLDATRVLCASTGPTSYYAKSVVATIDWDNSTISVGSEVSINDVRLGNYPDIILLDTDKALFCGFNSDDDILRACVLTVSGTTITVGTYTAIDTSTLSYMGIVLKKISSTKVLLIYEVTNRSRAYCKYLSVDGTNVSVDTDSGEFIIDYLFTAGYGIRRLPDVLTYDSNRHLFLHSSVDYTDVIIGRFDLERRPDGIARSGGTSGQSISCYDMRQEVV